MSNQDTPVPLFIDTNAFVAAFNEDDVHHVAAITVFDDIRDGTVDYGPLFTSRYVISETATTVLIAVGHSQAVEVLQMIRGSPSINVLDVDPALFDRTVEQFEAFDDQRISFIDHMNAVLAAAYDIDHIFAFDDDFATLGLTRVPVDTGDG